MFLKELSKWLFIIIAFAIAPLGFPHLETTVNFSSINGDLIVNICIAVIAACALGLTVWQGKQTRQHNKLTVMPHLTSFRSRDISKKEYLLSIRNNGLGPAIIEETIVKLDNHQIPYTGDETPINKAIATVLEEENLLFGSGHMDIGFSIPSNNEVKVLLLEFKTVFPVEDTLKASLNRIELTIKYKSIYEDRSTFTTKLG